MPSETSHEEKTAVGIEMTGRRGRRLKGLRKRKDNERRKKKKKKKGDGELDHTV